jgi:lysozyme
LRIGKGRGERGKMIIRGIDVSHYQGQIDWGAVEMSGIKFAFCKATEGIRITDHTFARNWDKLGKSGIYRGAYHFGHPENDAIEQAKHFH